MTLDDEEITKSANSESVTHARTLLQLLNTPPHDIGVDPDGDVSLDWYVDKRNLFSLSVSPDKTIHYAGKLDNVIVCGTFTVEQAQKVDSLLKQLAEKK